MIAEGATMDTTTHSHKEHAIAIAPFHSNFFESLHKEQWQEVRLGEVAYFQRGYDLPKTQMRKGIYPVAGSNGIIGYHDVATTKAPCITIGRSGNIGKPKFYNKDFWAHNTALFVKDFFGNNEKFIFYLLKTMDFSNLNSGSAVPTLNRNYIHNLQILLPPLKVQQQIAEILSSFDDKIDLLHRQNKTLESLALTLFRHYTTNKELDSVIGDIVSLQAGFAFKSKDFQNFGNNKIIKIKNIQNSIIDILNTDFVGENIVNSLDSKFKILSGDILFGMTGAEIGKMGIVPQNSNSLWLNQRVGVLREKVGNTKFLAYLQLTSEIGFDYIINAASGSAQPNISAKDIENCPFYSLSTKELFSLSLQIKPLFDKIIQNLGTVLNLRQIRNMLLSKILNGKMEV